MAAYREIKEVCDGTLKKAVSVEHPIYQVAQGTSHDQTKSKVLQPTVRFQRPEKVYQEKQRHA